MTARTTEVVQARIPRGEAERLDEDLATLGLTSRSEALREGLRLLHRHAQDVALARSYDEFYGGREAPVSEIAQIGDAVAAESMTPERGR